MASPVFPEPLHVGRPNVGDRALLHRRLDEILDRNWLTNAGPAVAEFEERVADFLGVRHCVAMSNGTVALEIALAALEVTGEVIVPAYTFVATAHAVAWRGATPVFADIDPRTHNLDPSAVRGRVTDRTGGIIGVHLWGRPAPIAELQSIAEEAHVPLMFDAAHAFGCSSGGAMIGSFGELEILSFHATKFFNTFEGGALVTNDDAIASRARLMRNFGFEGFDRVIHLGTNAKMSEIHAAMGLVNLESMERVVSRNRDNHAAYRSAFEALDGVSMLTFDETELNNYQYAVIEVDPSFGAGRDAVVDQLHSENVLARKYFWPGCHRMEPYAGQLDQHLPHLARTEEVAERVIVLPTGTAVTPEDCTTIAGIVAEAAG